MEARQNQIYKLYKIESPEIPMPSQSAPATPPQEPGFFSRIFGAGTPPQPRQGVVDFNQLPPRN
jgi:hypothetical protein